jgi:hypothetical protein
MGFKRVCGGEGLPVPAWHSPCLHQLHIIGGGLCMLQQQQFSSGLSPQASVLNTLGSASCGGLGTAVVALLDVEHVDASRQERM